MRYNAVVISAIILLISSFLYIPDSHSITTDAGLSTRGIEDWRTYFNISDLKSASFYGEAAGDNSGYSVTNAGDVNGDGYDDILIGAIYSDEAAEMAGKTYLIFGRASGFSMDMGLSLADASFTGETAYDWSGSSLSGAGDVNGDGFDDILIGAHRNGEGSNDAGQTYLIFGKASGWSMDTSLSLADASFIGETSGDQSSISLSGAGDVNGDGFDDFLIGAQNNDEGGGTAGQTYLIFGKASGWSMDTSLSSADASFIGEAASDMSGYSVSGAKDVNGDGFDDFLIGAYGNDEGGDRAGKTYLVFGKSTGWGMDASLSSADSSFIGTAPLDFSGSSLSCMGDVNGDGFDDFLIGAYKNNKGGPESGLTHLIFGKSTGWSKDADLSISSMSIVGEAASDWCGFSVSGAGDLNGDGFDDLLIGAHQNDENGDGTGQTYLIFGWSTYWVMDKNLTNSDASFIGEAADDWSGVSVSGAGDVNGDGYNDLLIGASGNSEGGSWSGQTYLIFGKTSGWSTDMNSANADASFIGELAADYSGTSVSRAGDVNGDGFDDFLIGAYQNDESDTMAGQTYLIFGKTSGWSMDNTLSSVDASFLGEASIDYSGFSVSDAGDVNGDGLDDFLIGAYLNAEGGAESGQTYLIFGKASGWSRDTSLSNADASFIGEADYDWSGFCLSGAGDVNGDGFSDIVIGAKYNDEGGAESGQTYLIFGKASGWSMDTSLSNADASFIGEAVGDRSGTSVSGAGDVNGDGFDDILIGADHNDEGGAEAGQTYLIFGKASGWSMDTSLSSADGSFIGEASIDYSGYSTSDAGDVNGDGFHDFIIGAYGNDEGGAEAGQTYLIFGKTSGWVQDVNLSSSDASFIGEFGLDQSGNSVSGTGDVNGDGFDDILIGADHNDEGGAEAGQTYLIFGGGRGPYLVLDNDHMKAQMANGTLRGDLEIRWDANYLEDLINLEVSIYYQKGSEQKEPIIEKTTNSGTYIWNTSYPRVPDGDGYSISIEARNSKGISRTARTNFRFEINNPDPPSLSILTPLQYQVVSRSFVIEWDAMDGEDRPEDLSIDIWISEDDGESYSLLINDTENTGTYLFNSIDYPDGEMYRLRLVAKDTDGMINRSVSDRFLIKNRPSALIIKPEEGEVISGLYEVLWDADDPQDQKNELSVDILLIDGGNSSLTVADDVNNTGYFQFDSIKYRDSDGYRLMINITDTDDVTTSILSGNFSIFNNDDPSVEFITPIENQTLRGIFEVTWSSEDQESEPDEMTFALYYRFGEFSLWNELARNQINSGSFSLDTLSLIEGDGGYELQIIMEDPNGGISKPDFINFFVYNPDPPVIDPSYMKGPVKPVRNGEAFFEWRASDPDPGETQNLRAWILISPDNETWEEMAAGIPNENEYTMNVSDLEDRPYFVKIRVSDCQPGEDNLTTEAHFPRQMIVNNINDPPTIELLSEISAEEIYSKEITFRWTSSDPDGDPLSYTLYYRAKGENEWKMIPGAFQLTETNFTWNISALQEGYYQVKIVAKETTSTGIEAEIETIEFYVKPVLLDLGNDDHEVTVNYGMLMAISAGIVVLIIVIVWLLFLYAKKRRAYSELEKEEFQEESPSEKEEEISNLGEETAEE
ncbi:MAG: hypothetical protein ACMUIE_00700 [Thermoplasmatota archaeon]